MDLGWLNYVSVIKKRYCMVWRSIVLVCAKSSAQVFRCSFSNLGHGHAHTESVVVATSVSSSKAISSAIDLTCAQPSLQLDESLREFRGFTTQPARCQISILRV